MSQKPILLVAHPRACSSAFERVFIKRQDKVSTIHEPFGDAYWMGPERQLGRYEKTRIESGFAHMTYKAVIDEIEKKYESEALKGKRIFIKDMAFFLMPPPGVQAVIASSFNSLHLEPGNPTVIPLARLKEFHFTFLIRHPRLSVPSYYRLTLPPHNEKSQVYEYNIEDAGYSELRRLFDYLRAEKVIGPGITGRDKPNGVSKRRNSLHYDQVDICIINAEDLLNKPNAVVEAYCKSVGLPFDPAMLCWDGAEDNSKATAIINRWGFDPYFHKQALESNSLQPLERGLQEATLEVDYQRWVAEFGVKGANTVKSAVEILMEDYEYLKKFSLCV